MRPIVILGAIKENVKMLLRVEQNFGNAIIVRVVQLLWYFVFEPHVQCVRIATGLYFFQFLRREIRYLAICVAYTTNLIQLILDVVTGGENEAHHSLQGALFHIHETFDSNEKQNKL